MLNGFSFTYLRTWVLLFRPEPIRSWLKDKETPSQHHEGYRYLNDATPLGVSTLIHPVFNQTLGLTDTIQWTDVKGQSITGFSSMMTAPGSPCSTRSITRSGFIPTL